MKADIHPEYVESIVECSCGFKFTTRSTKPYIKLEICANCHPLFTGKQKFVDSAGRIDRFVKKYGDKPYQKKVKKKVREKKQKKTVLTTRPKPKAK
ncbi:MAG: 50S ribosomal protein L31 [bacterium]|nr:50S ribosomal protein L31 [bacterium]